MMLAPSPRRALANGDPVEYRGRRKGGGGLGACQCGGAHA